MDIELNFRCVALFIPQFFLFSRTLLFSDSKGISPFQRSWRGRIMYTISVYFLILWITSVVSSLPSGIRVCQSVSFTMRTSLLYFLHCEAGNGELSRASRRVFKFFILRIEVVVFSVDVPSPTGYNVRNMKRTSDDAECPCHHAAAREGSS